MYAYRNVGAEDGTGLDVPLIPWSKGFAGRVYAEDPKTFVIEGTYATEKDSVVITELPVGTWTSDVREPLDKMVSDGTIKDYSDTSTDMAVHMRIKGDLKALDKILKDKWKLTNMHAFNSKGVIQ